MKKKSEVESMLNIHLEMLKENELLYKDGKCSFEFYLSNRADLNGRILALKFVLDLND